MLQKTFLCYERNTTQLSLIPTYYEENIGFYSFNDEKAENKDYIVYCGFAGPVIGFDKKKEKYFPIWIPESMGLGGGWGARSFSVINMTNESIITLSVGGVEVLSFNIDKLVFAKL